MGRVKIRDVAAASGCSVTTVSQVLNDVPGLRVSTETRQRVLDSAAELGYRPNRSAQALRLQRSFTIGLLSDVVGTSPHAGRILAGIQDAARTRGVLVVVLEHGGDAELRGRQLTTLGEWGVDGIILAAEHHVDLEVPDPPQGMPLVVADANPVGGAPVMAVVPDEVGGAEAATRALTDAGHRRIAFINAADDIPAARLRLVGFTRALKAAGVPPESCRVVNADESAGGYGAAKALLADEPRPSGIFCFNDRVAMGAYQAVRELGLSIPGDVSLVGFDNQEIIATALFPGLSTIQLPHYEMGRWAATTLLDQIESSTKPSRVSTHLMPCPYVPRESVAQVTVW